MLEGADFTPMIFHTWGGLAGSGKLLWHDMVRRLTSHLTDASRSTEVAILRQGLSHAVLMGVGHQLENLLLVSPPPGPQAHLGWLEEMSPHGSFIRSCPCLPAPPRRGTPSNRA